MGFWSVGADNGMTYKMMTHMQTTRQPNNWVLRLQFTYLLYEQTDIQTIGHTDDQTYRRLDIPTIRNTDYRTIRRSDNQTTGQPDDQTTR